MAEQWPKGHLSQWEQVVSVARQQGDDRFDFSLEPTVETDKELIKIVPCNGCKRPMVVTTFYVLAWAKCWSCKGEEHGSRETASVGQPQAGRTEPRLAKDLTKVLINPNFANALCPVHPEDPDHEMELKAVSWSEQYGPSAWRMVDNRMTRIQIAPGETALLQCLRCNATVTLSTTAVTQFQRQNEERIDHKNVNGWSNYIGTRDTALESPVIRDFEMPTEEEVAEDAPAEHVES